MSPGGPDEQAQWSFFQVHGGGVREEGPGRVGHSRPKKGSASPSGWARCGEDERTLVGHPQEGCGEPPEARYPLGLPPRPVYHPLGS